MSELKDCLSDMIQAGAAKIIISNPEKGCEYKKIVIESVMEMPGKASEVFHVSKYTEKQVFHENIKSRKLLENRCAELTEGKFRQINGWSSDCEHIILISKKGMCNYKKKKISADNAAMSKKTGKNAETSHNRQKNYILKEGTYIEPLMDMGVFTSEGKVVNSMYDKYRQINRFLEIIDDEISASAYDELNIIDFGCGKSYLTFVVYYYLTQIKHIKVNMTGLDLKADVIQKCNAAAKKYGYKGLKFELGDINGYKRETPVDMVITLHACDTATDYALYNAICWKAKMIFSVPCCQHELNKQIAPKSLAGLTHYGIIKERFCALATDSIRGNLLEYSGYKTQLLEFIDFEGTPKNILIRAVRRKVTPKGVSERAINEINALMEEFGFEPTLYKLLMTDDNKNNCKSDVT
jgi:SAM-dependent methyltransferase